MIQLEKIELVAGIGTPLEKKIINQLDLRIEKEEWITVIGTNGAGKSTLLNLVAGECFPTSGNIYVEDEDVTSKDSFQRSNQISRVFQNPLDGSIGELTVAENMALARQRGTTRKFSPALSKKNRIEFQEQLASLNLGLEKHLDKKMNLLSGGQRQAVSLLMAVLQPVKILLLDEHTSALDPKTAEIIMGFTEKLIRERKLTALMVTHSLHQALGYGNRTLLLHNGEAAATLSGPTRSSFTTRDLMALYEN